jgi:hypothetical protein
MHMTDTALLRSRIKDAGFKLSWIADQLGITTYSLQKKLDNDSQFRAKEIKLLSDLLQLSPDETTSIFFA